VSDPKCLSCGACCQFAVVPPFSPAELDSIDAELAAPIREVWAHATDPSSNFWDQLGTRVCSWFDSESGRCKHYDIRPSECVDFEVGKPECLDLRKRAGVDSFVQLTVGESNAEHN